MAKMLGVLVLAVVLAGCTSPSNGAAGEPTSSTGPIGSDNEPNPGDEQSGEAKPLKPPKDEPAPDSDGNSAYISRVSMSSTSIELTWSASDGAVEYHIHRIPRMSDDKPAHEEMTAENTIHVASEDGRFVDDEVEENVRYWYGLRALAADGSLIALGRHAADAVDDTEPPSPPGNVTASFGDGEVLVTWTQPAENYELHGYQILRGVDGQELEALVSTWDLEQTSFVDDDPPDADNVTYAVVAFDFHWNNSEPAEIEVELSG